MDRKTLLSKYLADLGRKGGKARLQTMTAEERKASAIKASKAAAEARKRRAAIARWPKRPKPGT